MTTVPRRAVGILAVVLLVVALLFVLFRDGDVGTPVAQPTATTADGARSPTPSPTPDPSPTVDPVDLTLLDSPEAAASAPASALIAAGRARAVLEAEDHINPPWRDAMDADRPVYVGEVELGSSGEVTFDLAVGVPATQGSVLQLRFLPSAAVLERAGAQAVVTAVIDDAPARTLFDPTSALLLVDLPLGQQDGEPLTVRLTGSYTVPALGDIIDDGGPAGFGLLARSDGVTMLGHGLPVLTFDDRPMISWGDVGAFPVANWFVTVQSPPGMIVTGAVDETCSTGEGQCVEAIGIGLRDLAIASFGPEKTAVDTGAGRADRFVRVSGPPGLSMPALTAVRDETLGSLDALEGRLGPVPWQEFDVVLAPLRQAAGMEFPGLYVMDPEYLDNLGGGFGTFVVVHEIAHQWFHALVGNSSLTDAVVDESLAQYVSLWYYRDVLGEAAAQGVVDRYLEARYDAFAASGMTEIAPAEALDAFGSNADYGPLTYARAPFAWIVAENALGEQVLADFLRDLVARHGLSEVTSTDVRDLATELDLADLAAALDRWWFDPTPANDEVP